MSLIKVSQEKLAAIALASQLQEAKDYLNKTDHKMLNGYVPRVGEDLQAIELQRNSYREFIRENEEAV